MYGAETCRSGINILSALFTLHKHFVGFNTFVVVQQLKINNPLLLYKMLI
jgi:hypothetical protein